MPEEAPFVAVIKFAAEEVGFSITTVQTQV